MHRAAPCSQITRQLLLSISFALACTFARTAFAGDYFVDPAGKAPRGNGDHVFTTVQAAIDGVRAGTEDEPTRIFITPGIYTEHLTIRRDKVYLDLIGLDPDPAKTVLTFNLAAITPKSSGAGTVGTTGSASTTISANNFTAANLTFANSTPYLGSQAVALKTNGDEMAFSHCKFTSYQDTLYPTGGRQYFTDCTISGSVDYIFGNATAVFDHCTINNSHGSTVTAANTKPTTAIGFVFLDCDLTATDPGAAAGSTQLGRPWQYDRGSYASTIFVRCKLGPHISKGAWNPWDKTNDQPAGDCRYAEFGNTDSDGKPVDDSFYATWSHALTADQAAQLTLANIFGPASFWDNPTWGIGGTIWGPVNAAGTSNVKTAIKAKKFTDWALGGTWDPTKQIASAAIPAGASTTAPGPK